MSQKGCRRAVLAGCWKNQPQRPNIALTPRRALGGLPPQIEKQGSATTIKKQTITISLLERNKQGGEFPLMQTHLFNGELVYSVGDGEVHSKC